jgi:hypothetical protein
MNATIFYIAGAGFILGGIIFHLSLILLGIGIFFIGMAVGGGISNLIWHKLVESMNVWKALGYESKTK